MHCKRITLTLALCLGMLVSGCAFVFTPLTGVLYTGVDGPLTYDAASANPSYEVLGMVEGRSTASSVLGLVATGDASVASAYKNALAKMPGADALIEVTVDYKGTSVLLLYATYTTIARGKAIKFRE